MSSPSGTGSADGGASGLVVHAVVPAAGRGERYGGVTPKQFVEIGGTPLVSWTVERLLEAGCASVTVALPAEDLATAAARLRRPLDGGPGVVRFVAGGETRQESVAAALAASPASAEELVAVHDGARPAVDRADFLAAVAAAARHGGAVLGRAVTDTVKRVESGRIVATLDRRDLFRAETPQVFRRELLERSLGEARRDGFVGTDESSLVERLDGVEIALVEARRPNPKVTSPEDLALVTRILASEEWS
jgi:2-C-methyl-D-erythritol 4-phosphate cytidylyltransferase